MMSKVSKVSDIRLNVRGEDHFCHWHHLHYVFVSIKPIYVACITFLVLFCGSYVLNIVLQHKIMIRVAFHRLIFIDMTSPCSRCYHCFLPPDSKYKTWNISFWCNLLQPPLNPSHFHSWLDMTGIWDNFNLIWTMSSFPIFNLNLRLSANCSAVYASCMCTYLEE